MGLGIFLLLTGLLYLLVLSFKPNLRRPDRFWLFTGGVTAVSLLCLAGFAVLSVNLGLIQLGAPQNFNLPHDYMRLGTAGWGILLLGLAGVLSPIWVALFIRNRSYS